MKVCVIGAGVVGCATAYALCRQGHEVTLVDRAGKPGTGSSFANGAQLSYSFVEPLASPATLRALPAMLVDPDSPLRWRLRADWRQWAWGLRFLQACNAAQLREGTRRLLALAALSRATLDAWLETDALEFGLQRNGKLVLCPDASSLARQARQVALQACAGVRQEVLDRQACLAREPGLAGYGGFVGGIWTESECAGDPHLYCQALLRASLPRGLDFRPATEVLGFELAGGRARALRTGSGAITAESFVLAAGIGAAGLARALGESLPIYPIKGFSLTLAMDPTATAPRTSVTDLSQKMVLAPLGGRLRVAAMAEIGQHGLEIPQQRVDRILSGVHKVYPGLCPSSHPDAWAGLRPATPTSVPIIRRSRVPNVFLNVGHGALGFTLAAGSAAALAAQLGP